MVDERPGQWGRTVVLADGRSFGFAEVGDPLGLPLVLFHGTPSSRLDAVWLAEAAARTGWRVIAPDRPGHGLSDPQPGREVLDLPADVAELCDMLGIGRFAVLGFSGGAAYALATAHRLPDRVSAVALVSGWGPSERPGAYLDVSLSERLFDGLARRDSRITRLAFGATGLLLRRWPAIGAALVERRIQTRQAEQPDLVVVARALAPGEGDTPAGLHPVEPVREALRQGGSGPADDLRLIVSPWGFPVGHVDAPVHVWHGSADQEVPVHHAEFFARITAAGRLEIVEGGDHLMLFVYADRIFTALADEVRRAG